MKRVLIVFLSMALLVPQASVQAQSCEGVKTSTDILMFLPGAVGAGIAVFGGDSEGFWQLAKSGVTAVVASYALKYTIKKERPDGSDKKSFPSNHTAVAFAGAAYLQHRYGWEYGVPAYLLSSYVAWGRVYAKRHDYWDVLAGAAIGIGSAYIYTRPLAKDKNVVVTPSVTPDGRPALYFSMSF